MFDDSIPMHARVVCHTPLALQRSILILSLCGFLPRHSEAIRRPLFSAIVKMLSHSDSQLLSWNTRDRSVHPQVTCLGAPGEVSEELYQELQDYYSSKIEQI